MPKNHRNSDIDLALINFRIASARLVATAEDLKRISTNGHGDWIREARRAYMAADIALADAHIDLEDAMKSELRIEGRWLCAIAV